MAVSVEPAHHCLVDELVMAALDGASCRHRAESASRPRARVAGYLAAAIGAEPQTTSAKERWSVLRDDEDGGLWLCVECLCP
jgi:hypothetical protein